MPHKSLFVSAVLTVGCAAAAYLEAVQVPDHQAAALVIAVVASACVSVAGAVYTAVYTCLWARDNYLRACRALRRRRPPAPSKSRCTAVRPGPAPLNRWSL